MPGYIEDRWWSKKPDPGTGKRLKTARYGKGKRWRVAGIPGVRDRSFANLKGEHGAEAWLRSAGADSTRGHFYDPRDGNITLRDYVEQHWWPALRVPPSTREAMKYRVFGHILPHIGELPLNRIGGDEVNRWVVDAEAGGLDAGTVRTSWRHLSSILQAALEAKRIPSNPCRGLTTARPPAKPKQKARALDREAMAAVRAALAQRYQVLVDLGVGAGLRQGEALGFSPDDVDGGEIQVVRQVMRINSRLCFGPPKGHKERAVPIPKSLSERIQEHADVFPTVEVELPWVDPDRPNLAWDARPKVKARLLVTTVKRNAVNRSDWNALSWKPALEAAGLVSRREGSHLWEPSREFGYHVTRHTYASVQLHAGESVVSLARWLGHADPAFTLRTYTHFMPDAGSRGVSAMDSWLRGSPAAPDGVTES
ncbi:MAG TPA: site-specific integrase [Streptomyces sp.]|nr:site-specific integrase [Streptomyces sp.]